MQTNSRSLISKVPEITIGFWIIKICATTLGETAGDEVSMTLKLGYLLSTAIFFALFVTAVTAQIRARRYYPWLYWTVILTTTMAGTTLSDFFDRTAQFGYAGGSALLLACLCVLLFLWRHVLGSISFNHVVDQRVEGFYWATIFLSNTLGTALGDYVANDLELGFVHAALLFGSIIAAIALLYFLTKINRALLFWAAFVLTRPLGATLGDSLTKPHQQGGMQLGTLTASLALAALVIGLIAWSAHRNRTAATNP
jgi:uncharacterized membrane-anchored protein